MARVVGAGAADHGGLVADLVLDGRAAARLLLVAEGRRLAGGAGDDDAVGAVLDQVAARACRAARLVHRAVLGERGHHRREHACDAQPSRSGYRGCSEHGGREDGRAAVGPGPRLLELGGDADQDVLAAERRDELDADRQPVVGPVQRQRDRRLAGGVEERGEDRRSCARARSRPAGPGPESSKVPSGGGGSPIVGVSSRSMPPASNQPAISRARALVQRRPPSGTRPALLASALLGERPGERLDVVGADRLAPEDDRTGRAPRPGPPASGSMNDSIDVRVAGLAGGAAECRLVDRVAERLEQLGGAARGLDCTSGSTSLVDERAR